MRARGASLLRIRYFLLPFTVVSIVTIALAVAVVFGLKVYFKNPI
jgi:hypothetical protein